MSPEEGDKKDVRLVIDWFCFCSPRASHALLAAPGTSPALEVRPRLPTDMALGVECSIPPARFSQ